MEHVILREKSPCGRAPSRTELRKCLLYVPNTQKTETGHWAEGSTHFEALLSGAAYCGALRHWTAMRAREPFDANGTLSWLLRRRWGMTFWRSAARLLLDRLSYVGRGAMHADGRRADAAEAAAVARRAARWLFRRPRARV